MSEINKSKTNMEGMHSKFVKQMSVEYIFVEYHVL